ncbi:Tetratricopeptide repeat protein [Nonomuraea coxensis DSM 45129]|uniref:Tetratricopeptide repeat protein n=1 Tax=Nonomuraea coxensis DSM 45129 TaxID=1122611 RepID=A0ABX8U3E1_9ACTN|nr:tetratricopeptide repeat protein [Nonomuraea coxensis]QYC42257.1 Tetratricopeptide repeat protein [Nonomuraea coxensis DSM 45129]
MLADTYARGRMFFQLKDYIEAARHLAAVVAEAPGDVAARLLLARAYYHSAQLGRAEAELRQVIERDPAEAYAYLLLGRTLERRSRPQEAAPYLRLHAVMTGTA